MSEVLGKTLSDVGGGIRFCGRGLRRFFKLDLRCGGGLFGGRFSRSGFGLRRRFGRLSLLRFNLNQLFLFRLGLAGLFSLAAARLAGLVSRGCCGKSAANSLRDGRRLRFDLHERFRLNGIALSSGKGLRSLFCGLSFLCGLRGVRGFSCRSRLDGLGSGFGGFGRFGSLGAAAAARTAAASSFAGLFVLNVGSGRFLSGGLFRDSRLFSLQRRLLSDFCAFSGLLRGSRSFRRLSGLSSFRSLRLGFC